eukprot:1104779-Pyramimonas_sp.AAC.1
MRWPQCFQSMYLTARKALKAAQMPSAAQLFPTLLGWAFVLNEGLWSPPSFPPPPSCLLPASSCLACGGLRS